MAKRKESAEADEAKDESRRRLHRGKSRDRCPKRTRRKGERKSLERFPDAQLAMQIPTDEDDERN